MNRPGFPLIRVISGGQTGVDRGALDAALDAGFACGGWCPPERAAEDGRIPTRFPLRELPDGGYAERTARNIDDSDGTLIIHFGGLHGGTRLTAGLCTRKGKPHLLIDASAQTAVRAAEQAHAWIMKNRIRVLNVAGPRQSHARDAHDYAHQAITTLVRDPPEAEKLADSALD